MQSRTQSTRLARLYAPSLEWSTVHSAEVLPDLAIEWSTLHGAEVFPDLAIESKNDIESQCFRSFRMLGWKYISSPTETRNHAGRL